MFKKNNISKKNLNILNIILSTLSLLSPAIFLHIIHLHDWGIDWSTTRLIAWIGAMSFFMGIIILIGFDLKGRALGVLINERNRYSLSRLQMMLWTTLVLTSMYVMLLNNIYEPGDKNATFSFDWQLFVLLGVSVGNFISTPMLLTRKTDGTSTTVKVQAGALNTNTNESEAALSDLILGEESSNASCIDIGRIQMLMMTLMAVMVYGWMIGGTLIMPNLHIEEMPRISETLLSLIVVSHVGYLTGKITPTSTTKGQTVDELSRVLMLSQKATDLVHRTELLAKDVVTNNSLKAQLVYLLPLTRSLASETAALSALVGTEKFDSTIIPRLEGKYEALNSHLSAADSHAGTISYATDAPNPNIVRDVQQKLAAQGMYLMISGVVDTSTYSAIDEFLGKSKISRSDLSPEPYRMFEEMQTLLT